MKKTHTTYISLLFVLFLFACNNSGQKAGGASSKSLDVEAYIVHEEAFSKNLHTTANLMAKEHVELVAPISGKVLAIYFNETQRVKKGDKLLRLDDRTWQAQLLGVQTELAAAKKDHARKQDLLTIEGSSQEEIDNAFTKIQNLKAKLQELQVNISLANLRAPFSGQLGMRNFSEGAFLKQGDYITSLSANEELKVDFTLPQIHQESVHLGKNVRVLVGQTIKEAKIYALSPIIDDKSRTISVRALLKQSGKEKILPGTFAEVQIKSKAINNALLIPTQAVVPSILEQTVYLYKNGKAKRKLVELGDRTADRVHIVSGIATGDTILTTGLLSVKDGMPLNIKLLKE
jgi:membrane fusion protein (multidrug efflux system)